MKTKLNTKKRAIKGKSFNKRVKEVIERNQPLKIAHNGPGVADPVLSFSPSTTLVTAVAANTLTSINTGDQDYNRSGNKIKIVKIELSGLIATANSSDAVRLMLVRNVREAYTGVSGGEVLQNNVAASATMSLLQDDTPYTVLWDKVFRCNAVGIGNGAGPGTDIYFKKTLHFKKRPLIVEYTDVATTGVPTSVITGGIELMTCGLTGNANTNVLVGYNVYFHDA